MEINVYSQYFEAQGAFNGVERRGALVLLISESEAGTISYRAATYWDKPLGEPRMG